MNSARRWPRAMMMNVWVGRRVVGFGFCVSRGARFSLSGLRRDFFDPQRNSCTTSVLSSNMGAEGEVWGLCIIVACIVCPVEHLIAALDTP
jgi:hypothetical protein